MNDNDDEMSQGSEKSQDNVATDLTNFIPSAQSVVAILALIASTTLPFGVHRLLRNSEQVKFEKDFLDLSLQAKETFGLNVARMLATADIISTTTTAEALNRNATWPFVAIRDFHHHADSITRLSNVLSIDVHPFVSVDDRQEWEEVFVPNNNGWMNDTFDHQNQILISSGLEPGSRKASSHPIFEDLGYSKTIYSIDFLSPYAPITVDKSDGPFFPSWQAYPVSINLINFNYFSYPGSFQVVEAIKMGKGVLGKVEAYTGPEFKPVANHRTRLLRILLKDPNASYQGEAGSVFTYPIFDSFDENTRQVVGGVSMSLHWPFYFKNLLPPETPSVDVVVVATCGLNFTMRIDGEDWAFIGTGDHHNTNFDDLVDVYELNEVENHPLFEFSETSVPIDHDFCPLKVLFYPTKQLQESFMSSDPLFFSLITGGFLLVFGIVLATYGWIIRRRFKRIIKEAIRNGNYVSSIFPEHVRERLMQISSARKDTPDKLTQTDALPSFDQTSVADCYPNCTIFFAKVAGFGEWSTNREPEQMFELLEAVFQTIDRMARRHKVYKIETIAETYLAATGLPKPQDDHGWRMAKFARDCVTSVDRVLGNLREGLGADTADLKLQIGIHSGAVTAGVMGGQQKARFQVFGDTVNTSSRMMGTGMPGRVHVSSAAMKCIAGDSNQAHQLEKREGKVFAKGKGAMDSYWLKM